MLLRIVKLHFKEENISAFKHVFETSRSHIQNFEGCSLVDLYQDANNPNIFFTYSHWDSLEALENYRHSDFFKGVWKETKKLFGAKPEAWSLENITS